MGGKFALLRGVGKEAERRRRGPRPSGGRARPGAATSEGLWALESGYRPGGYVYGRASAGAARSRRFQRLYGSRFVPLGVENGSFDRRGSVGGFARWRAAASLLPMH